MNHLIASALVLALFIAPTGAPALTPAGWQIIMTEDFEGPWPSSGWTVADISNDGYQRYWGRDDFKAYTGAWSVWPASGGAHAVDPEFNVYPDNMDTHMVYGPFNLSDAIDAEVTFSLWYEIEVEYDYFSMAASANGSNYTGLGWWEDTSGGVWEDVTISLADFVGNASVWVRWDFSSDDSVGLGGAFMDNITISKKLLDAPTVSISRNGSDIVLSWPRVDGATAYEVWWAANAPYFTPGSNCDASPANCKKVTTLSCTHTGASGSTADNYFYVVLAVKDSVKSVASDRVGEFDFGLVR